MCVFHLWVCFAPQVTTFPSTSFTGISLFLKPPVSVLVILYSVAMFCVCAAASASSARFSMKALLSALVFLLLTSLSSSEYLLCSCSFSR